MSKWQCPKCGCKSDAVQPRCPNGCKVKTKKLLTFKAEEVDGQWEVWARVKRPAAEEDVYFMVSTGSSKSDAMSEAYTAFFNILDSMVEYS